MSLLKRPLSLVVFPKHPVDNRKPPRRITSPRGIALDRGKTTREAIRAALPGTYQDVVHATGLRRQVVEDAIKSMAYRREVEAVGEAFPAKNGAIRKIWGLVRPPTPPSADPWHNAWFRG